MWLSGRPWVGVLGTAGRPAAAVLGGCGCAPVRSVMDVLVEAHVRSQMDVLVCKWRFRVGWTVLDEGCVMPWASTLGVG